MTGRIRCQSAPVITLIIVIALLQGARAHPLDPLSPTEILSTVAVLRAAHLIDGDTMFPLIDLEEPPKASVLAWPNQPIERRSFVVARRGREVYEGVVDLVARSVVGWRAVPGVQSSILAVEWRVAQHIAVGDPGWQAAMRKRGYTAFNKVFCAPFAAGYLADPREEGRRLLKVACFGGSASHNIWSRPIEGLYAIVDLDERKVIRLIDEGATPVSRSVGDFIGVIPLRPVPAWRRRDFSVRGNGVAWKNWSFRFRMDRRTGLVLSLVRYNDHARPRMILYRGSLSEMFVPYMDPDIGWLFRTPLDVGEYGLGLLSSRLAPGIDCPRDAVFLAATLAGDDGEPVTGPSRICLFERRTGDPLWRHAETETGDYAGHPATELVVRTIPAVGNYDYIVDWVLTEAGDIRIDVGATGIVAVKGVPAPNRDATAPQPETQYGTFVEPDLVAVNHDHFLSFRLDVDIDGTPNTLVRRQLVTERLPGEGGRRSLWRVVDEDVRAEGPLGGMGHEGPILWRIVNPELKNAVGRPIGYELRLDHTATSLLSPDDLPQRRAAFSAAPLWVTAYEATELYAAGLYPNQSKGGAGLPAFAANQRPVVGTDIVLWCTMGFHHLPRLEDWPVMPTMRHSLSLVPDGFFDRNPSLGSAVPAQRSQQSETSP